MTRETNIRFVVVFWISVSRGTWEMPPLLFIFTGWAKKSKTAYLKEKVPPEVGGGTWAGNLKTLLQFCHLSKFAAVGACPQRWLFVYKYTPSRYTTSINDYPEFYSTINTFGCRESLQDWFCNDDTIYKLKIYTDGCGIVCMELR